MKKAVLGIVGLLELLRNDAVLGRKLFFHLNISLMTLLWKLELTGNFYHCYPMRLKV